ncbi:MAG: hypothetical protein D6694_11535 [Gammaproteobacteria bacterium]|nr:MAG: hypothetical protein D6694_11535 [Gammaproteobacteria bacterium]
MHTRGLRWHSTLRHKRARRQLREQQLARLMPSVALPASRASRRIVSAAMQREGTRVRLLIVGAPRARRRQSLRALDDLVFERRMQIAIGRQ